MRKPRPQQPAATPGAPQAARPPEERSVLAVTVGWMLTVLCSLAAHLAALAALAIVRLGPAEAPGTKLASLVAGAMLLAALVTGILCLLLTPLVWRLRTRKPPKAIVAAAILIGLSPLATWLVLRWA